MVNISSLRGSAGSCWIAASPGQLQTRHFAIFLSLSLLGLASANLNAQTIETNVAVIVQHAPALNCGGVIRGSLQQLDGENVTLNGGFEMTGDLLVPGTPTVVTRGRPDFAGTIPGAGSSAPSGYRVFLDGDCTFHYLRTRTTPVKLPTVLLPPPPKGTRKVTIIHCGQSYGNPDTLLDLTLGRDAGFISVPPGTYRDFTVNGGAGLVIGAAGGVQPSVYNLRNLTLNGNSIVKVVGPVILTVANGFTANGRVGNSKNPAWLQLNIASGNFTLNCGSIVYGLVTAPNGQISINRNSVLVGTATSANFELNGNGFVRWAGKTQTILPPAATNETIIVAENGMTNINLTGSDPQNLPLTYSVLTKPVHGALNGTPPNLTYRPMTNFFGADSFTFDVNDGVTNSPPATISLVVTQLFYPPTAFSQTLTNLENTALPVTLTGSNPQNDPLTYTILSQPSHGTLSGTAPNLVYQPAKNYLGNDAFTFQANDGARNSAPATISIVIKATDEPPMVTAGSNQLIVLPDNTLNLNGSVSYSEFPNSVDTVIWSQVSGPGKVIFGDASNISTTAAFGTNGFYVLQLYASDSFLSASNTLKVTVDAPPVVNAGPETTNTFPGSITLQGAATDDGLPSGVLNLNWSEVGGPETVIFSNPSGTNSLATFSTNGIYLLRLTADDGVATNYADVTVIENLPPIVNTGANILTNGLDAILNGSVSDDGLPGGYLAVQWAQSSGPGTATFSDPTGTNTVASVDQSGVYVFTLIATDGATTNSSEVDVTFNLPPVMTAGAGQTVNYGTVVTLAGVATDDHLPYNVLNTIWNEMSGPGTATFAGPTLTNTTVTFDQPGVYDLRLTADDGFATNSADVTIQVHAAPIVSAGSNQTSVVGSPVTLDGSFVDDGLAGPAATRWSEISGPAAASIADPTATNTVVTFNQDGLYVFALTVTDGLTNGSAQVVITSVQPPGVTVANPSLLINWPANHVTLNGTVTSDGLPPGGTLTSAWSQISGPAAAILSVPAQNAALNGLPISFPSSSVATFSSPGIYVFQLTANTPLSSVQSNVVVTVNQPPAMTVGMTQTNLFPAVAQLSGTVTDDGLPLSGQLTWSWSVISGPGTVTFNNAALTNATAAFSRPGLYVLQLTASDSAAVSSGQVTIVEDTAPSVRLATNSIPAATNPILLTGTVADDGLPPGAELTAAWGMVSGPAAVAFSPPVQTSLLSGVPLTNVVQSTATFSVAGTYVIGLAANDSFATNFATVSLVVTSTPPVVSAGPDLYLSGVPATATLNGQVSDAALPLGATLTQQWSVVEGPGTVIFGNPASSVTTATFSTNGIYVLQLTANNGQAQTASMVEVRVETLCTVEDPQGLAAWWPANGNAVDAVSGQSAILNGVSYVNGEVALAFTFNGKSYVRMPATNTYDVGSSPAGFSLEFWTKGTPGFTCGVLGWSNGVVLIEGGGNNGLYVGITDTGGNGHSLNPVANVFDGQWHHVAVTYDRAAGVADVYKDGVMMISQSIGSFQPQTSHDLYLGLLSGLSDFEGQLDEISLYGRPLNPEEVYNIYASGSVGKCPDDNNAPPMVSAGPDLFLGGLPATATLNGEVIDPALPPGGTLSQQWSVLEGPGTVTFGSPDLPVTTAAFSTNGIYVLQLTANNGEAQAESLVEIRVETLCTVEDPQGLSAWWPADGTAEDVVSGNFGIPGGGTSYTSGEVALAFNFNGSDNFVDVPAAANYNVGSSVAGFSLEFWTKGTPNLTCGVLGWKNGVTLIEGGGNNGLYVSIIDTGGNAHSLNPVVNVFDGQWHHVAVTYDRMAGVADVYKDGVILISQGIGSFQPQTTNDFYMGQVSGSADFKGQLDEISMYLRPLDPEEVYNIYASGSVGKCPDTNTLAVYAGPNFGIPSATNMDILGGSVTENGQAAGTDVQVQWTEYYGPGPVVFANPTSVISPVMFSTNGIYILQLTANNEDEESSGLVEVRVGVPCDDEALPGLLAWWPADGTAKDVIGGNDAVLGGSTGYTNGEVALAFNFDGVDDYVLASAATNYNLGASPAGMTIEFWTRGTPNNNCGVLGWKNGVSLIEGGGNNGLYVNFVDTNGNSHALAPAANVFDGQWHHVAVTYDRVAGMADVYKDGVMLVSQGIGSFQPQTTNDFYMGQVAGNAYFRGQLDEISLYGEPLSADDIAVIYAFGNAGKCPGN
jgi:hypothetical protein